MAVVKASPPRTAEGQIDYEQLYYTAVLILGGLPSNNIPYMRRFDELWTKQFGFRRESTVVEWLDFLRWAERQQELS